MNSRKKQHTNNNTSHFSPSFDNTSSKGLTKQLPDTTSIEEFPSLNGTNMSKTNMSKTNMSKTNTPLKPSWTSFASNLDANLPANHTLGTHNTTSVHNTPYERHIIELSERQKQHLEERKTLEKLISNGEYYSDSEDSIHEYVEADEDEYSDNIDDF
jgi:hypothetical protein